jgi:hypothetical protein
MPIWGAEPRPIPTVEGYKQREKQSGGRNFIPLSDLDKQVAGVLEKVSNKKGVSLLNVALAYVL